MIGDNDPFDFDSLDGQMTYLDREIDGYGEVFNSILKIFAHNFRIMESGFLNLPSDKII